MRNVALKLMSATAITLAIFGCFRDSAADTARAFERAMINGDAVRGMTLITRSDREATGDGTADTRPGVGEPATVLDSLVATRRTRDTVDFIAYRTSPNWESVGGRFDWTGGENKDRATDYALAKSLPRVLSTDSLRLVREDGQWRVWLDVHRRLSINRLWLLVVADESDSAFASRVRAAREYLSLGGGTWDSTMKRILAAAPYGDSVSIQDVRITAFQLSAMPIVSLKGKVVNRSHRALARVSASVRLTSGEHVSAWATNIAPGRSGDLVGSMDHVPNGEVDSVVLTNVDLAR